LPFFGTYFALCGEGYVWELAQENGEVIKGEAAFAFARLRAH